MGRRLVILTTLGATLLWAQSAARDLAAGGERSLQAGRLLEALDGLRRAREAMSREAAERGGPDRELAEFLALQLHNLGVRFNNDGQADGALDAFLEALRIARAVPNLRDPAFRASLRKGALSVAAYVVASGRTQTALEVYELLEHDAEGDPAHLIGMGTARLARGEIDRAEEAFERAARMAPDSAEAAAGRGRVALARAERVAADEAPAHLERAVDLLREAAEREPASAARHRELAAALGRRGERASRSGDYLVASSSAMLAERSHRRAVEIAPDDPAARVDLVSFLMQARRHEEALAQIDQAERAIQSALAAGSGRNRAALEDARRVCREQRALASYNMAVDAINRSDYQQAERHLAATCAAGGTWQTLCASLRETARARAETFRAAVRTHEAALKTDPGRAEDLLALGDLYAAAGAYDRALGYYRRLESAPGEIPGLRDRIAAVADPGQPTLLSMVVDVPGGRVTLRYFRRELAADLERAVKAAWLRVTTSLGAGALRGDLWVTVHPNRRAFRTSAGYRVGGMAKGSYGAGHVQLFETPSHTVVEWVAGLTHEMAHHAVERLSAGRSPRWLSEGLARWVEGDTAIIDRGRVGARLASGRLHPLGRLDDVWERSWNDADVYQDVRDQSLLAVEEMARRGGPGGMGRLLDSLAAEREPATAFRRALGASLEEIDASWREGLRRSGT